MNETPKKYRAVVQVGMMLGDKPRLILDGNSSICDLDFFTVGTADEVLAAATELGWIHNGEFTDRLIPRSKHGFTDQKQLANTLRYIISLSKVASDYQKMIRMEAAGIPFDTAVIAMEHDLDIDIVNSLRDGE